MIVDRNADGSDQGNALRGLQFPRTKTCIEDLVWVFISFFQVKENLCYSILELYSFWNNSGSRWQLPWCDNSPIKPKLGNSRTNTVLIFSKNSRFSSFLYFALFRIYFHIQIAQWQDQVLVSRFQKYLKVVSTIFLLVCFSSLKESTSKTWKNVFYFTSKALFVLQKIKF